MGATARQSNEPIRQCAVTKRRADKGALLRLVLDPEGRPFVDLLGKAPGRGVYVAPDQLEEALHTKALSRVFRGKAKPLAPDQIQELVEDAGDRLEDRVLELVGLARRAGALTIGMDATLSALKEAPRETVVVVARDISERSRRRIDEALAKAEGAECVIASTTSKLGRALGRETVGVALVRHASLARALRSEGERIAALTRGASDAQRKND